MAESSPSLATPLVIAALGLAPLALLANRSEAPPAPAVLLSPVATEVVVTVPAPTIDGIADEIARVLAAEGFAANESVAGLPPHVAALLNERGAVLTVEVEGGS